ncbi:MAG: rhomboid family intramembrane serine protease, partial [Bacteroidia bacterium]|nr:rhomboid family intramembrane serine protease [Bacteroidia bacterium]
MNGYGRGFMALPPVVKNLILINVLMLIATWTAKSVFSVDLTTILGLYFPKSEQFMPLQIITHMFMHANFWHLFFNMFALYMFGGILENVWGPKRFLIYYMVCGLGAAFVHETVILFQYNKLINTIAPDQLQLVLDNGAAVLNEGK